MSTHKLNLFGNDLGGTLIGMPVGEEPRVDIYVVFKDNPRNVIWITKDENETDKLMSTSGDYLYKVNASESVLVKALNNIEETDDKLIYQAMKTIVPKMYDLEYLQDFYNKHCKEVIGKGLANKSKKQLENIVRILDEEGIGLAITINNINFPDEDVLKTIKEMLTNM